MKRLSLILIEDGQNNNMNGQGDRRLFKELLQVGTGSTRFILRWVWKN